LPADEKYAAPLDATASTVCASKPSEFSRDAARVRLIGLLERDSLTLDRARELERPLHGLDGLDAAGPRRRPSRVQRQVAFKPVRVEHARGREVESLQFEHANRLCPVRSLAEMDFDEHRGVGAQMLLENRCEFRTAGLVQVHEFIQASCERCGLSECGRTGEEDREQREERDGTR
jgi:hypothetical protein